MIRPVQLRTPGIPGMPQPLPRRQLATLVAMPEDDIDPIASTQMFRNFVARPDPAARRRPDPRLLVTLVLLALLLGGVLVWLAAR